MFSGPTGHPVVSYSLAFTTPSAMVGYASDSCQGVSPSVSSFSTHAQTHSMPVSFMTRPAASYIDTPTQVSGQEVVWYPDSGATHHITNNRNNLQSDAAYIDSKSSLNGKDGESAGATNFPLVLVSGDVELVNQPSRRKDLSLGQSGLPIDRVAANSDLGLGQTSQQSASSYLGPGLRQTQSAKGVHSTGSSPLAWDVWILSQMRCARMRVP
ncbi:hypothetical protein V6N11_067036 [Hibiscus sabdariffa]|uniref:Uncharacterized protein n=1 Tax=Hibiscus sabdariffa TaxID=183260 RepID=A0ABR2SPX5_9ROSI